ncbi:MAG: hypothetical protein WAN74_06350 [Thermoplasmata archaeon]
MGESLLPQVNHMVAEKTLRFQGKNRDLSMLGQQIVQQLQSQGYKVQSTTSPTGTVIQAAKAGILRDIIAADRVFSILISGQPDDFTVRVGIGKLIQNLAVTAVEALLLTELFLVVDVPEMLWTVHVEKQVIQQIEQIVASPSTSAPIEGTPLK